MTQAVESRHGAFDSDLAVRATGAVTWGTLTPLIWTGTQGDTITVPVGFETDFATVPRFLRWLINTYGPYTRAAVLHDWLLKKLADWEIAGRPADMSTPIGSRDTDGIFRRAMADLGVPWLTRWAMWTAVRWASLFSPLRAYQRQILRDLPAMLGISVAALPFVAFGAVPVLACLTVLRIVNAVIGVIRKERS